MPPSSLVAPIGYSESTCGYCSPPGKRSEEKTSKSYGVWAYDLSPYDYQDLIDSNWRRSGKYMYKPDNLRTCCPHLTIRQKAQDYRPGKRQRRALSRLFWEVRGKQPPSKIRGKLSCGFDLESRWSGIESREGKGKGKAKGNGGESNEAGETIGNGDSKTDMELEHTLAGSSKPWSRRPEPITKKLKIRLVSASTSDEKYALFRRYQIAVHNEAPEDVSSREGFERFLVHSPIRRMDPAPASSGVGGGRGKRVPVRGKRRAVDQAVDLDDQDEIVEYGSYHQEYWLDGKLIAVGVLDILPRCISSVYLFYDPAYEHLQLGKISAMREILLVRELQRRPGMEGLEWYYMGYYIHDCQKMKYKATYRPSEILDVVSGFLAGAARAIVLVKLIVCTLGPQSNATWHDFDAIKGALDKGARFDFLGADHDKDSMDLDTNEKIDKGTKSKDKKSIPIPFPPGFTSLDSLFGSPDADTLLGKIFILLTDEDEPGVLRPLSSVPGILESKLGKKAMDCIAAMGREIATRCILVLADDEGEGDSDEE